MNQELSKRKLWQGLRFVGLSGFSFLMTTSLMLGLCEVIALPKPVAYAITLVIVFFTNFLVMRYFVFRSKSGSFTKQLAAFAASTLAFRALEYGAFILVCTVLGVHYLLTVIVNSTVFTILKFFFYGNKVFKGESKGGKEERAQNS